MAVNQREILSEAAPVDKTAYTSKKEPYISTKELNPSAKNVPCISKKKCKCPTKEPNKCTKEPYISTKEPNAFAKTALHPASH